MAEEEDHLFRLFHAAEAARSRYIALALVNVTGSTGPIEGPTPEKLATVAVAEAACEAADRTLAEYQAAQRWATPRD